MLGADAQPRLSLLPLHTAQGRLQVLLLHDVAAGAFSESDPRHGCGGCLCMLQQYPCRSLCC